MQRDFKLCLAFVGGILAISACTSPPAPTPAPAALEPVRRFLHTAEFDTYAVFYNDRIVPQYPRGNGEGHRALELVSADGRRVPYLPLRAIANTAGFPIRWTNRRQVFIAAAKGKPWRKTPRVTLWRGRAFLPEPDFKRFTRATVEKFQSGSDIGDYYDVELK